MRGFCNAPSNLLSSEILKENLISFSVMIASIVIFTLAFLACVNAYSPSFANYKVSRQSSLKAIPDFNWPGSKIPPSPLEQIFGGGKKYTPPAPEPEPEPEPEPVKKGLFSFFPSSAPAKPVASKIPAKPVVASKSTAKAPVASSKAAEKTPAAPTPAKKSTFKLF